MGKGIGKAIKLLVFQLGLWVPIAYSLVFLLAMLASSTPLSEVAALYWIGLAVTTALGVCGSILLALNKNQRKKENANKSVRLVPKNEDNAANEVGFNEGVPTRRSPVTHDGAPAPERLFPTNEQVARQELGENYAPPVQPQYIYPQYAQQPPQQYAPQPQYAMPPQPPEQPKIYRTRMDANMLIYEYSDRLEFYKATATGLTHLSTEYKK